jgi:hypothetical protein
MDINNIAEFCNRTLIGVVSDLNCLKIERLSNKRMGDEFLNLVVDFRIASIKKFIEEVNCELNPDENFFRKELEFLERELKELEQKIKDYHLAQQNPE